MNIRPVLESFQVAPKQLIARARDDQGPVLESFQVAPKPMTLKTATKLC